MKNVIPEGISHGDYFAGYGENVYMCKHPYSKVLPVSSGIF